MSQPDRIYLDNAATSWPKPEAVYTAVDDYLRTLGAPAGRSAYREASEVERLVSEARKRVATLIGVRDSRRIVFTHNGTDSLNLAIHGLLRPGDHVVTTVCEHNSVLRPLRALESAGVIEVTRIECDSAGIVDPRAIEQSLRKGTRLIAITHASNVTGTIQPIEAVGQVATEHQAFFLVDAAQSLGHLPVDVRGIDLLAAPGHKGLLGPLGIGILYVAPGVEARLLPTRQGGTGTQSENDVQPESLPDRYESGNHNVPGILGLNAGVSFVQEQTLAKLRQHEQALTTRLLEGLASIRGITVHGSANVSDRVGLVSITIQGYDPQEAATLLDSAYSIQVRSGLHCAPLMHQSLGTDVRGGTLRFSLGPFNTTEQIDLTLRAIDEISGIAP